MKIKVFKKQHKIKIKGIIKEFLGKTSIGVYGIKACSFGFLNIKQVETARRILVRVTKKLGIIIIRIHFYISKTKKPLGSRMGRGVGSFKELLSVVVRGMVLFEISNVSYQYIKRAFNLLKVWFPIKLRLIKREVLALK